MAMVKVIRKPLTDVNNRDFMTGEFVPSEPVAQEVEQPKRIAKWIAKKKEEAIKAGRLDGKILVDGFGWVS